MRSSRDCVNIRSPLRSSSLSLRKENDESQSFTGWHSQSCVARGRDEYMTVCHRQQQPFHSLEAFFNCPIPFHVDWFAVVGQTKCINFPGTPLQTYAQTRMYLVTAIKASVVFIRPRSRTFSFDTNLRWWVSGDWWCWQHKVKGSSGFIRKSHRSLDKPMYVLRNRTWKTWIGRLIQTGTIPYIDFPSTLRGNFERNMISIENSEGTI